MKIGIVTKDQNGRCSTRLCQAMEKQNITPVCFGFDQLAARIELSPEASIQQITVKSAGCLKRHRPKWLK